MTDEEMIKWARIPGTLEDMNAVAWHESLKRLIWIARSEEQKRIWARVRDTATLEHEVACLSSYHGDLMPSDEDFMAALGPCGK